MWKTSCLGKPAPHKTACLSAHHQLLSYTDTGKYPLDTWHFSCQILSLRKAVYKKWCWRVSLWLCISYTAGRLGIEIQGKSSQEPPYPQQAHLLHAQQTQQFQPQSILMPHAAPHPCHLSSILGRDAAVTDLGRGKCSFSATVPFEKKRKSNSAGSGGFHFNHFPFALSRDCSQRKSCFEASLFHVPESISLCSEIHNTKRLH